MVTCKVCNQSPTNPRTYRRALCDECASYAAHAIGVIERQLKDCPYDFDGVMQRFCDLTLNYRSDVTRFDDRELWKVMDGFIEREVAKAVESYSDSQKAIEKQYNSPEERRRVREIDISLAITRSEVERHAGRTISQQREWERNYDLE